jgi:hypothetical protein
MKGTVENVRYYKSEYTDFSNDIVQLCIPSY